jgi:short-subunit dehydrogenase
MTSGFAEKYGPWAFIAGASTGIGAALSHEAARRGLNVLMMARGAARLNETADAVGKAHGVQVRTLAADLADSDITARVARAVDGLDLGLFVYNAAVAPAGRFLDVDREIHLRSVAVNCATPVALCHLLGRPMVARGRGGIALVSSNGAIAGAVNFSTYNAGKAFEWILAETLWTEFGESGVDVAAILVGATASPN